MVLARVAEYLSAPPQSLPRQSFSSNDSISVGLSDTEPQKQARGAEKEMEEPRHPYHHAMLAGGIGGVFGDSIMHSLDTVKTRQQGDPHRPPKYNTIIQSYWTIFRQEGVRRGLYGGYLPMAIGSFGGTSIFFGMYEFLKRVQIDFGVNPSIAYLNAGMLADVAASPLYVPTEVLKTRLQLQGRHNNKHFKSGYNYRGTYDAVKTIYRTEGLPALFYGYKATLQRDLPFSALTFLFYEQLRSAAKSWVGSRDIGIELEILTGLVAGSAAGTLSCPMDVVKTRLQTQVNPAFNTANPPPQQYGAQTQSPTQTQTQAKTQAQAQASANSQAAAQRRHISTSSPTSLRPKRKPGSVQLNTTSVFTGLKIIYKTEGIAGWFRGVGPRAVWTGVQTGAMLVLYQKLLRFFEDSMGTGTEADI